MNGLPGMPFSLVQSLEENPIEWLRNEFPLRLKFLMRLRPDMSETEKLFAQKAKEWANLALKSIEMGRAFESSQASILAVHNAWLLEISIGAKPRIEKAIKSQRQKEKASQSAIEQKGGKNIARDKALRILLEEVPKKYQSNKSESARYILRQAGKKSADNLYEEISKLSERQIINIGWPKKVGKDRR